MKAMKFLASGALILLVLGCGTSKDSAAQEYDKQMVSNLVNSKQFYIESTWALPQRGNRINLISNANYLKFDVDTVEAYLPFFGVRQMAGNYGSRGGIEFNAAPEDLSIQRNKKDTGYEIDFQIKEKSEGYRVYITVYDNKTTRISVNSNQRDLMQYEGEVEALPKE